MIVDKQIKYSPPFTAIICRIEIFSENYLLNRANNYMNCLPDVGVYLYILSANLIPRFYL